MIDKDAETFFEKADALIKKWAMTNDYRHASGSAPRVILESQETKLINPTDEAEDVINPK